MQIEKLLQSDNWWLEGDKAYICASSIAAIFCLDMATLQCHFLAWIPDCPLKGYRINSYCRKYKNKIFCIPYDTQWILHYDLEQKVWGKIEIGFKGKLVVCMDDENTVDAKVWLMERGGRTIYQVDLEKEIVEKKYVIPKDKSVFTGFYVLVQNSLYCTAGNGIHCIDIHDGNVITYTVTDEDIELYTICYDGYNFWLSGNCETIYIWRAQEGIIKTVEFCEKNDVFLKDIPLFGISMVGGQYVWHIPLQYNSPVLYIDKEDYRVGVLERKEDYARSGGIFKYGFEYIRQNRYIGLYSVNDPAFFEIDVCDLCINNRKMSFHNKSFLAIAREYYREAGVLFEGNLEAHEIFSAMLYDSEEQPKKYLDIGRTIYSSMTF